MYFGDIWITERHTGKMEMMCSVSTCRNCNKRCMRNAAQKGSICEKCYAKRQMEMYKDLRTHLEDNFNILTKRVLAMEDLPLLNSALFRIESFGDIANTTQALNYIHLIKKNPHVHFGWWTKNCDILAKAIEIAGGKPDNVQIIRSSMWINKPCKPYYNFVDKTFTVYEKGYAEENGIKINCGGRKCIECRKCYLPNDIKEINEMMK